MENDDGDQILVTSPKKKLPPGVDREKLVRQMSGDRSGFVIDDDDDEQDDGDEYVEEVIEDSDDDEFEEIIDSDDEDGEYYEDSDGEDEVEILEVDDDDDDGVEDGTDSASEFDPLPPPIQIPNALRPAHLRTHEDEKKKTSYFDDDSSNYDTSDDDDDSSIENEAAKTIAEAYQSKNSTRRSQYNYGAKDTSEDSDSDTSVSLDRAKTTKGIDTFTATGRINKDADDYDEDDSESQNETPATATAMTAANPTKPETPPAPEPTKEQPSKEQPSKEQPSKEQPTTKSSTAKESISSDPAVSLRPATVRGYSFESTGEELGLPVTASRGGKKPGKWAKGQSSIYSQNGVTNTQPSGFTKPKHPETTKEISENRPSEVLGQFDATKRTTSSTASAKKTLVETDSSTLRSSSTVQNKPIRKKVVASGPKGEPPEAFKVATRKPAENDMDKNDNSEPKDDGNGPYYSYEDLMKKKIPDLDYLNREKYLSPYDFKEVFKVTKSEFATWPKWKQTKAKRSHKLF